MVYSDAAVREKPSNIGDACLELPAATGAGLTRVGQGAGVEVESGYGGACDIANNIIPRMS